MKWLREYFYMDKRQERGFLVLIFIMILVIAFNRFAPGMFARSEESLAKTRVFVEKLPVSKKEPESVKYKSGEIILEINRFFDPNTISLEGIKQTKLPTYVAENWIKYRNSGAVFKKTEDVSKIYGLKETWYNQLKPWIIFTEKAPEVSKIEEKVKKEKDVDIARKKEPKAMAVPVVLVGINSADSMELLEVNGIGPYYAGAIVGYRQRLGGYRDLSQLMELYKMDSIKLERMLPQLYLDSIEVEKIAINTASFKEILRHPYIDYETTKYIANKRNKLGKFAALYQLQDSIHLPDSLYQKILPYISLDH